MTSPKLPTNRKEFKEYIMRRLGFPVIEINVDAEQVEDRINDAIAYFQEYHFDGTIQVFYKHQITQQDLDNQYIPVPEKITGITKLVDAYGLSTSSSSLFDVTYQMMLNDFFNITAQSIVPYYLALRHISLFQEMFSATPGISFNRKTDKIFIQTKWSKYAVGEWLVFDGYEIADPDEYPEIWADRWLLRYATALVKRQWGENISKFSGTALLGGQTFNGERILREAIDEITKLEDEMINSYSLPVTDFIAPGLL